MSAALVRKSLAIVDGDTKPVPRKKSQESLSSVPRNQRVVRKVLRKGRKEKIGLLHKEKKLTVNEARKTFKSKDQVLRENLAKLKAVKEAVKIQLDDDITSQLIERAVTRRPIQTKKKKKKVEKSVFTEEDFKKFEEEYFDED